MKIDFGAIGLEVRPMMDEECDQLVLEEEPSESDFSEWLETLASKLKAILNIDEHEVQRAELEKLIATLERSI